jgi:hypothetical protein
MPQGLAQHVSKSQDAHCRHVPIASQVMVTPSSIQPSAVPPALDTLTQRDNRLDAGAKYELLNDFQMLDGAFAATCVVSLWI